MLDDVLLVIIIVALVPYVLGPIVVRFAQRWPAQWAFEPYDPILHPLPDDLAAAFRESVDALIRTGMRVIADFAHASAMSKLQLRVALLADASGGEHALVIGGRSTNPKVKLSECYIDFPTKFGDGGTLSVTNTTQPEVWPETPLRRHERFPAVRDPARLRRINAALLEQVYGSRPTVALDPMPDPAAFIEAAVIREYEIQAENGYVWLDAPGKAFRPTWRGAWLMSLRLLPPLRQILDYRRRRRARTLLAQFGLSGPDERPIKRPVSRDQLAWNLVLLVAIASIYMLARGGGGSSRASRFEMPAEFHVPVDFAGATRALESLAAEPAQPLTGIDENDAVRATPGVAVHVADGRGLVTAVQDSFLARGFYLFVAERHYGVQPDLVGLFPRRDPYEIIRLLGTNGANYDISPDSIVAWFRRLERDEPFVFTGIGFDWIEGRFTRPVGDPAALARRFHAFCPDIVEQGTGSVEALARELRESPTLYCWWD